MSKERPLDSLLRARVTEEQKCQLEAIARINQWKVSDVVRQALRDYLAKHYAQDRPEPDPGPSPPPGPGPTDPPQPPRQLQPELAGV